MTAVKTMDETMLNCDDVDKLFTLLTKKKYHHVIKCWPEFHMLRYVLGGYFDSWHHYNTAEMQKVI